MHPPFYKKKPTIRGLFYFSPYVVLRFQLLAEEQGAPYNLSMEKKILKFQLYSLFILTTLNLIYFYYRDNLPDNYYEITYQNQSINFFTYYFFRYSTIN
jgi:hypothetical protein